MDEMKHNSATNDIEFDSTGNWPLVTGIPALEQRVQITLSIGEGEYSWDLTHGLPVHARLLGKNPAIADMRSILTEKIAAIQGVKSVSSVLVERDPSKTNARLTATIKADTDETTDVSVEI